MITTVIDNNIINIKLRDEITSEMENEIEMIINALQFEEYEKVDTIKLWINSGGGSILAMFGILDSLKNSNKKIITVNSGVCASAAALLFLSGNERVMYDYSLLMLHSANGIDDEEVINKFNDSLSLIINNFFTTEEIENIMKDDTWLNSTECKNKKLSEIIKTDKVIDISNKNIYEIVNTFNNLIYNKNDNFLMKKEEEEIIIEATEDEVEEIKDETTEEVEEVKDETETTEEIVDEETIEEEEDSINNVKNVLKLKSELKTLKNEIEKLKHDKKVNLLKNKTFISDTKAWLSLDLNTIENLLKTIKVTNSKPALTKNSTKFEDLSIEERKQLAIENPELHLELIKNYKKL